MTKEKEKASSSLIAWDHQGSCIDDKMAYRRRILNYVSTRLFEGGGLSAVTLNYCRQLWANDEYDNRFIIDFISHGPIKHNLLLEIEEHGGRYIELPSRMHDPIGHSRLFSEIARKGSYDVLHFNYDSGFDAIEFSLARRHIPVRICHVHNPNPRYKTINTLLKPLLRKSYTKAVACSKDAGEALYGESANFLVLNNAIQLDCYAYDAKVRHQTRSKLGIDENVFVVGNVGRMSRENPKNHGFLIRAFALALEDDYEMQLVIVGDGELMSDWIQLANELSISEKVRFTGFKTNVADYLQAFDLFCFPSRWEGFGMAAIEAQAAGLPVLLSEAVPDETKLSTRVKSLPVRSGDERIWAKLIVEQHRFELDRHEASQRAVDQIRVGGYDITTEAEKLVRLYDTNESPTAF